MQIELLMLFLSCTANPILRAQQEKKLEWSLSISYAARAANAVF